MSLDKVRDWLLILTTLVVLWVYASGWVISTFIEKAQLAQKLQQCEKQQADKAKEEKK